MADKKATKEEALAKECVERADLHMRLEGRKVNRSILAKILKKLTKRLKK